MVRYVTEEVDRVKSLFQEKEGRLMSELDSAKETSKAAAAECKALQEELSTAQAKLATVTSELEVCFLLQHHNVGCRNVLWSARKLSGASTPPDWEIHR